MRELSYQEWSQIRNVICSYESKNFEIVELFGTIDNTNFINKIDLLNREDQNLYQFLLINNHFSEAKMISIYFCLIDDSNLKVLINKVNEFYTIIHKKNNIDHTHLIIDLITKINILSNLDKKIWDNSLISYKQFQLLMPIIDNMINEYYMYIIENYIKTISEMIDSNHFDLEQYIKNFIKEIQSLPINRINLNYQNIYGKTILMIIATMRKLPIMNDDLYNALFKILNLSNTINIYTTDDNQCNLLHYIMINSNNAFLKILTNINSIHKNDFTKALQQINNTNKTPIEILLINEEYQILTLIIKFIPKMYISIAKKLIDDEKFIDLLPIPEIGQESYLNSDINIDTNIDKGLYMEFITILLTQLQKYQYQIIYDISKYNNIKEHIISFINKKDLYQISYNANDYSVINKWLYMTIDISSLQLFSMIINNFYTNDFNHCLNKIDPEYQRTLIMHSIITNNFAMTKILLDCSVEITDNLIETIVKTKNIDLINHYCLVTNSTNTTMTFVIKEYLDLLIEQQKLIPEKIILNIYSLFEYILSLFLKWMNKY
jgi:hypothetical protein